MVVSRFMPNLVVFVACELLTSRDARRFVRHLLWVGRQQAARRGSQGGALT